jgi:hypothetical protein
VLSKSRSELEEKDQDVDMGDLRARGGHIWCPGKVTLQTQAQADAAFESAARRAKEGGVAEPKSGDFRAGKTVDCSCVSEPLDAVTLARVLSKPAFEAYLRAKELLTKVRVEEAKDAEFRQRLLREQAEWQRVSEEERQLRALANEVRETILNCRCPKANCGRVFQDFEGCFALKCSSCNTAFCGWCLADCGADAHGHVRACAQNRAQDRGYFAALSAFEQAMYLRRTQLLQPFLARIQPRARAQALVRRLLKDLLDLRLVEVLRAYPDVVTADKSRSTPEERRRLEQWEREALELVWGEDAAAAARGH